MDSDAVIGLLMLLLWIFSSLVARFGRRRSAETVEMEPREEDRGPSRAEQVQQALRDLAEQMGVEIQVAPAEEPVASEHRETASEHRRTRTETRGTVSEHREVVSEHRRVQSEVRQTSSEIDLPSSEHDWTSSEHVRGDLRRVPLPAASLPTRRRRSVFARRLQRDLVGGGGNLARAIVLREILGPPVSLRSPSDERG